MLDAHRIQHRCVSANIEGGYELADDEPCLVLRQLAASESAHAENGAWEYTPAGSSSSRASQRRSDEAVFTRDGFWL